MTQRSASGLMEAPTPAPPPAMRGRGDVFHML